ncbi:hypothetical protein LXA43DRAFT_993254 [Ganoderma leucocontextum]|nr:hypothetical protein LXA43DRAFT_993254 [Ganoderma leucocontextum]
MDNRPPVSALRRSPGLFARPGEKPPLYYYGFPFTLKYTLDYARRHHLTIPLAVEDRERFGGRPELDLAELTDSLLEADEEVSFFATAVSPMLMVEHLSRRCHFRLEEGVLLRTLGMVSSRCGRTTTPRRSSGGAMTTRGLSES